VRNSLQAQPGAHPAILASDASERLTWQQELSAGCSQDAAKAAGANAPARVKVAESAASSRRIGQESCAFIC
jgi:hypothetical protein